MLAQTTQTNAESRRELPAFLQQEKLEPILVVITAIAIAVSLILERSGANPTLVLIANIVSYVAGGWFGLQEGLSSLFKRELNVDLLMVLAALGAATVNEWHEGAILLFLFSLSNVLQAYAIDRSRNAIKALLKLRPDSATVRRGGTTVTVPVESLLVGDEVIIKPGDRFPIDGRVIEGESTVDQAPITGESMPVLKTTGDDCFAGTVNQNGSLVVSVIRGANDTTLARIIKLVEDAQGRRARTQRFLDEFEQKYALFVIVSVALFIVIPPIVFSIPFEQNFYRAMVLMTVASPCALVISTPASVLSAIANAARRGILFKGGAYLEDIVTVKAVALDKTGTITTGQPAVTDIVPYEANPVQITPERLLRTAASVELRSEHPIARAVVQRAKSDGITTTEPTQFEAILGQGVRATLNGHVILVGTERLMSNNALTVPADLSAERERLEGEGKTVLLVYDTTESNGRLIGWLGAIAVADQMRPNAAKVIQSIRDAGVERIVILTGDNERVAASIAKAVGADEVRANLLPDQKVSAVETLKKEYGTVAMVGDGVNDAPALAAATIGIAMGAAGTDVALETADVVLMSDELSNIAYAIHLSRHTRRVVWQNIAFSLGVIVVLIISTFIIALPLPLGVVGHEGSTLIVVANGLRLLTYRPSMARL
jgi:Zn2+/Cd2+-exporting ATPase